MGLSIVAGCENSRILAEDIYNILKHKYKVNDINIILPRQSCDYSKEEKDNKARRNLCIDKFPDSEIRMEIGRHELNKIKDTVVFVKYLYEPTGDLSINDHIMEAVAFGDLTKNLKIKKLVYVIPYLPYVRAHSIDKYIKKEFYQTDTLKLFIKMMELAGVSCIITIDPHSEKVWRYCQKCEIKGIGLDPFNSKTYGIFKKYYEQQEYRDMVIVIPDDGSDKRTRSFAYNIGKKDKDIAIVEKKRTDAGKVQIVGFKKKSKFKIKDIKGKSFLIVDDMISSGGTVNRIACFLKDNGATRIETWISHAVAPNKEKIEKLCVDRVLALDTVIQDIKKIETIKAAGNLFAHALYKTL